MIALMHQLHKQLSPVGPPTAEEKQERRPDRTGPSGANDGGDGDGGRRRGQGRGTGTGDGDRGGAE